jgi:chaperone modulatory protein CbpM
MNHESSFSADAVCRLVPGLSHADLQTWVEQDWVRPPRAHGQPAFDEVDIARVRLIVELRTDLAVEDTTLPLILSLLDQLYATRSQLRNLVTAADAPTRARLAELLTDSAAPANEDRPSPSA